MMAAVAAAGLGTAVQAATTFQADLMVDDLVGYFDGSQDFSVVQDVGVSLMGMLPSVVTTSIEGGVSWSYAMSGSMDLIFQGVLLEFKGQISGLLDVFTYEDGGEDGQLEARVDYSTSFSGVAEDGTEVTFGVSGFAPGDGGFGGATFDVADAEALIADVESGSFVFDAIVGGDCVIPLELNGPRGTFRSEPPASCSGSSYRVEAASDVAPSPVPLPAGVTLLGAALASLGLMRRRSNSGLRCSG